MLSNEFLNGSLAYFTNQNIDQNSNEIQILGKDRKYKFSSELIETKEFVDNDYNYNILLSDTDIFNYSNNFIVHHSFMKKIDKTPDYYHYAAISTNNKANYYVTDRQLSKFGTLDNIQFHNFRIQLQSETILVDSKILSGLISYSILST